MTQAAPGQSLACAGQRHGSRNGCPGRAPASKAGRHSGKEHDAGGQGLEDRPAGSLLQQPGSQQCNHGARCGAHRLDQGRRPVNGKERHKRPKAHNRGPVCGQECGACREARSGEGLVRLQAAAAAGAPPPPARETAALQPLASPHDEASKGWAGQQAATTCWKPSPTGARSEPPPPPNQPKAPGTSLAHHARASANAPGPSCSPPGGLPTNR